MGRISFMRGAGMLFAAGLPLTCGASESFIFDPDGPLGDSPIVVSIFDWLPSSALAVDTLPLPAFPAMKPSVLLSHAKLGNFLNAGGSSILGTGLNGTYEITFVGASGQLGTLATPTTSAFTYDSTGTPNFFEVYWDSAKNANELAGTGFNDGTLILSGTVTSLAASFGTTSITPEPLDQFGTDNYPAIDTGAGVGGGQIAVDVIFANPAFFPNPDQQPKTLVFNTSQITPFRQVDPSAMFTDLPGGGAPTVLPILGAVNGSAAAGGVDVIFQADANMSMTLAEIIQGACRMTGGGVTVDGEIVFGETDSTLAAAIDGKNRYTFGGQVGAPTASQPQPSGEWTHHQFQGPAGDFVFRAGTASAPKDTFVSAVTCSDPGFCHPARPAPFKQLDWQGIGSFRNAKGSIASLVNAENDKTPGYSRHYVRVHIEDLGEPGPGGKQPKSGNCPHIIGDIVGDPATNPGAALVCSACADVYQIEIHATDDPNSAVIYEVGGFIDNGNLQIHPAIK
jgi:hypothetical protein